MLLKILKKDFLKKKVITIALFIFILLSALLAASGSNMILELANSLNYLFVKSQAPHFVQMHAGEFEQGEIDKWTLENDLVKSQQTVEMLNIDGANIYLGDSSTSEEGSVMDISLVKQNREFDFLLNLNNEIITPSQGEIAVPVFFMQQRGLEIGDKVRLAQKSGDIEFTVAAFVRDVQMNPSIIHSKRFVISDGDYERLRKSFHEVEYLIEFELKDLATLSDFSNRYQDSTLPAKGPAVDYNLFKALNAITDGIVAAVIILVSLLLNIIALLCLRFTILTTIEEDYKEIGVMKAIGIQSSDIKRIYLAKYFVMALIAAGVGFFLSFFLNHLFLSNIMLYIGSAPKGLVQQIIPLIAALIIFMIVVLFCMLTLRRFNKISAVEALRSGSTGESFSNKKILALNKSKLFNVNIFLGLRDVFFRFKIFRLLFFIFFVCTFIIIVPVNFLNTVKSPAFITYMGIGRSDIRIDLRQSDDVKERFDKMKEYVKNDKDVDAFSPLITCRFKIENSDGVLENISVETGDFSIFPLDYLHGAAPSGESEIALSYLNAKDLDKTVGDRMELIVGGVKKEMQVTGIYQDVTNGGRTAKAALPPDYNNVLWYVVSLDLKPGVGIKNKIDEYTAAFEPAKVTHIEGYLAQTLGNTIGQLKRLTILAVIVALFVSILITSLFLKMLVAKDYKQIAIMKSLGLSSNDIRTQYITKALLVLNIGIVAGTIISNTIGQSLVSVLWSMMGASKITFVIDPVQAYMLCPASLIVIVTVTTLLSIFSMNKYNINEITAE